MSLQAHISATTFSALQTIFSEDLRAAQECISGPLALSQSRCPAPFRAEDFDRGCEGIAYHDTSPQAVGDAAARSYRISSVYLDPCQDEGRGLNVGHIEAGEWLTYTVVVADTGLFDLDLRMSCVHPGGQVHVEL